MPALQLQNLKGDISGGLTAAIVALPLALAFGVSSGAGAIAGIYGAICVGFFAALFGGTPSQVSGPTGPMTVVMAAIFTEYAALDPQSGPLLAFTVVMLGGAFQVLFGVMRLGKYVTMVPFPVISGFMSGIGVIIIALQLGPLLGSESATAAGQSILMLPGYWAELNTDALILGLVTLLTIHYWPHRLTRYIPSPLFVLLLGTALSWLWLESRGLPVIGDIPQGWPNIVIPEFPLALLQDMLISALMLAALGSIDSLLTSLVADNMTRTNHDPDRELFGQGIGNLLSGFIGGLPGAGATMRTVVNIQAGGSTRLSGAVHALVLLFVVAGASEFASYIPHALLAGILIKVGLDIIDWRFIRRLHRTPPFVAGLMLLVLGLTVFVDLIVAVVIGVFLANMVTVRRLAQVQLEAAQIIDSRNCLTTDLSFEQKQILLDAKGGVLLYRLTGPVSYAAAKGVVNKLQHHSEHHVLVLDLTAVPMIDVSTAIALEEMIVDAGNNGQQIFIAGMDAGVNEVLEQMRVTALLPDENLAPDCTSALHRALRCFRTCQPNSAAITLES